MESSLKKELYHALLGVRNILEAVSLVTEKYPNRTLSGWCIDASFIIKHYLLHDASVMDSTRRFDNWEDDDFPYGEHVWLLWKDHIIDITATQFGIRDKVVITPWTPVLAAKSWFWKKRFLPDCDDKVEWAESALSILDNDSDILLPRIEKIMCNWNRAVGSTASLSSNL